MTNYLNNNESSIQVQGFDLDFGVVSGYAFNLDNVYKEDYTIVPKLVQQNLHTKNKLMTDDICVLAIPRFEVSNEQGGETLIIGVEN